MSHTFASHSFAGSVRIAGLLTMCLTALALSAPPSVPAPGVPFAPPDRPAAPNAPRIFSHHTDAGPDETFLLVGEGLTEDVVLWGTGDTDPAGTEIRPKVQFCKDGYLAATLPQRSYDGVFVGWVRGEAGWSEPFVLNAPEAWSVTPDRACANRALEAQEADRLPEGASRTPRADGEVTLFGRNLARRPDFDRSHVLALPAAGGAPVSLQVLQADKYALRARIPEGTPAGEYALRVHTGVGGAWGWSNPLPFTVLPPRKQPQVFAVEQPTEESLRTAIAEAAKRGGGVVELPPTAIELTATLQVPAGVILQGANRGRSVLRFVPSAPERYTADTRQDWGVSPWGGSDKGDVLVYEITAPAAGEYDVWFRYACDQTWWKNPGMSGRWGIAVNGGEPARLMNVRNTGGFEWYRWRRTGRVTLREGANRVELHNIEGGKFALDAMAFTRDADLRPSDDPYPQSDAQTIVLQAEDVAPESADRISLPGVQRPAVWLAGDGAGVRDLAIEGSPMVDTGVLIRHADFPRWIADTLVERVRVTGIEGKRSENRAVHFVYALRAVVRGNELWGRSPLYFSGARLCEATGNRIVPMTRFGGNATGAIQARTNILDRCIIADNVIANAPAQHGGVGTAQRMIWLSTGHGSVSNNYIARNRSQLGRFGGVPGTDQNVGENILFEACQRYVYSGAPAAAEGATITLPATLDPTDGEDLGTVNREGLAYDEQHRETPAFPPPFSDSDGTGEGPANEYFVVVLEGPGMGQTRRIVRREGETLHLDAPWRVAPTAQSRVLVSTLFHRNLVVANEPREGMSGVQLWFTCIENVVADNIIRHHRGGALSLYGRVSTLASSKPRMWNRGLAPCHWNVFEGNHTEDHNGGASFSGGFGDEFPCTFPLLLGNVLRHNSLYEVRGTGVSVGDRGRRGRDASPSVAGTIVEFNTVRNAPQTAYAVGPLADYVVLRRNHAWFWSPPLPGEDRHVVLAFADPGTYALEDNVHETRYPRSAKPTQVVEVWKEKAAAAEKAAKEQAAADAKAAKDKAAREKPAKAAPQPAGQTAHSAADAAPPTGDPAAAPTRPLPPWRNLPAMPTARHDLGLVVLGDLLHAVGGATDTVTFDAVEVFDPIVNRWAAPAAPLPQARAWAGSAALDGKLYCMGGTRIRTAAELAANPAAPKSELLATLYVYDPVSDRWTPKAPMAQPRAGLTAAALDGKVYAVGGNTDRPFQPTVEVYDPRTDRWTNGPDLPEGRMAPGAAAVDGKLYVIGGGKDGKHHAPDVFILDPATGTWTRGAPMPVARRDFGIAVHRGRIWCIGGLDDEGYSAAVTVYDPATDAWETASPLPSPRAWGAAAAVRGRLYFVGGADTDPKTNTYRWLDGLLVLDPRE